MRRTNKRLTPEQRIEEMRLELRILGFAVAKRGDGSASRAQERNEFSQAACNAGNAMACVRSWERSD